MGFTEDPTPLHYIMFGFGLGIVAFLLFIWSVSGKEPSLPAYARELDGRMKDLATASRQVDELLRQLRLAADSRASAAAALERDICALKDREKNLRDTISDLEKVPLPVADRMMQLLRPGQRQSAVRDYVLFAAGVVTSMMIAIVIELAL